MGLILVVDDEKDACLLMQRILSASGHDVYTAKDARIAMEWLRTHVPDVALLDIELRGANGIRVLEHIRQNFAHTRVLVITGSPSGETVNKALDLGIDDYLVKPIDIDELEERVKDVAGAVPVRPET